jgi:phosphatidylserine decarboxylase
LFISRYGYDVVGVVLLIVLVGSFLSWMYIDLRLVKFLMIGLLLLLLLFTLYFFRDPERTVPSGENIVIAPADGKIIQIAEVREDEFLHGEGIQISIFMSPLNVHVNRYPITGSVGYYRYYPGEFLVAFDDKASLRNERTHIGVARGEFKVLFKQIAGFVARRIVAEVQVGDPAVAGARFGMIKFGSRVDVILPRSVRLNVAVGQTTSAGETILASIP